MSSLAATLPAPSADALALSSALAARLVAEIARAGGYIDFARYMQAALYEPGLGYYSAGSTKLGAAGDFVTAPELGPWLGKVLALTLARGLDGLVRPRVLELGAGTGKLAAVLLDGLTECGRGDVEYWILETSADLRERQRDRLARFGSRVRWLEHLPAEPFCGAIVANEVVDALPARRFVMRDGGARPLGVGFADGRFYWREGPADAQLAAQVAALERALGATLPDGYRSELRPDLPAWLEGLAAVLAAGTLLFVDYGYTRADYYRAERSDGTLRCHYRHRAHDDPFLWPGLQDLTAWVDFSALADAARGAGLTLAGYTTQAQFVLGELSAAPAGVGLEQATPQALAALKTLVLPGEMGEHFKVMLLGKNRPAGPLPGRDFRDRL
jgi:SAM-dependent MidA family methyltransferase